MKDLILVSAYCPDEERKQLLLNCINSLQPIRGDFDILISSHSFIPEHIANQVDYVIYDRDNELITDWDLMNTPWFSPFSGLTIVSSLISNTSVYLAVYKLLISAMGFAKNLGYKTVHFIEYDSVVNDSREFYLNRQLIGDYVAIQYKKEYRNFERNLAGAVGFFQSFNLDKLNPIFTNFNRDSLLEILRNSPHKTNEIIGDQILKMDGFEILTKDYTDLTWGNNLFNLSENTAKDTLDDWTVPYYDTKTGKINVIVWNSKKETPITSIFVFNKTRIVTIENVNKFEWRMEEIEEIELVNEILVIVNDKIKCHIDISTPEKKQKFIKTNQSQYK